MGKSECRRRFGGLPFLVLAVALVGGCATQQIYEQVDFAVQQPAAGPALQENALVAPGSEAALADVSGVDSRGNRKPMVEGTEYDVEVQGATYDSASDRIRFHADRRDIPPQGYVVTVRQPDGSGVSKRFKPDFALTEGPAPEDVEEFDTMLVWREGEDRYEIPQGTTLIPGEIYELVATAVDKLGRMFSTDSPTHPIPPSRLNLRAEKFRARGRRAGGGRRSGQRRGATEESALPCRTAAVGHHRRRRLSTARHLR